MNLDNLISDLYASAGKDTACRALLPMGYTAGLPLLTVDNGYLCAVIPFLRYKITGQPDKTLVYPVKFLSAFVLPDKRMVRFSDLEFTDGFEDFDFGHPCGTFRHESIRHLDKNQYMELKNHTLHKMDEVVAALLDGHEPSEADETALAEGYRLLLEPSLYGIYEWIAPDFFNKYIRH